MAFPQTPLDLTVELDLAGTWTDVTSYVQRRDGGISVTRGRADEASVVDPSSCRLALNNRDGRFSPRNPTSPYYGQLGRNTPIRVQQGSTGAGYYEQWATTGQAAAADSASLSITGDIDIRIDVEPFEWLRAQGLAAKMATVGVAWSWAFWANEDGTLGFFASSDGTSTTVSESSTTGHGFTTGRHALRVTLDVNNGAAGHDLRFYTSDTIAGTWTQLGSTITNAGVVSIFDSTADVVVGAAPDIAGLDGFRGRIYGFELFASVNGTDERADVDFTTARGGAGPVDDEHGFAWTLTDATVVDPSTRFAGEMTSLPQRWDPTGNDVWTPVEAAGVLRRLGQGADTFRSAIYRATTALAGVVAYWPCEDESESTSVAAGVSGVDPMRIVSGAPTFAGLEDVAGSEPLIVLGTAVLEGVVPAYSSTETQVRFVVNVTGETDGAVIASVYTTGTAREWRLVYRTGGDVQVTVYDDDGAVLAGPTIAIGDFDGATAEIALDLTQDGADIDYGITTLVAGVPGTTGTGGTITTDTFGRVSRIRLNPSATLETMAIGHVVVTSAVHTLPDIGDALTGYSGETAGRRIERLCEEESLACRWIGDPDESVGLGVQTTKTLVDLLREAETSDGGILYEPRDFAGIAYRTRESMYTPPAALTLDYASADLSLLEPTDDDEGIRNDITVSREGGSSGRHVLESGALSVQAPPDGVGRYDDQIDVSLVDDTDLVNHAAWRVHLGTVDETRYPQIGVQLSRQNFTGDATLTAAVKALDIGDRLVVENPPAWLPPGDISQLAQGFAETLANFEHDVTVNCSPASPWNVGILDDDVFGRLDTDGSTLAAGIDSDDTSLSVATTNSGSPLWTTDAGHVPFDVTVGGEVMTVTAISGGTSPQTFTVTRSVNGVVKAHSSGTDVRLTHPLILAL